MAATTVSSFITMGSSAEPLFVGEEVMSIVIRLGSCPSEEFMLFRFPVDSEPARKTSFSYWHNKWPKW